MNAKLKDKIWTVILYIISCFIVFILISLISYVFYEGRGFLNPNFLFKNSKSLEAGGGVFSQLFNSIYMLIITLLISVPIGIYSGIYLSEYAKKGKFVYIVKLCIETMASLPSIVIGLFGLLVFVNMTGLGFNLLSGALAVSILNLPTLTTISESAISSVSKGIKEGSLALGATKFQTIKKIVLPAAFPKIMTGIILASGRILGEAAALLYTSGMSAPPLNFSLKNIFTVKSPFSILRPAETLSVHIWKLNSEGIVSDASKIAAKSSALLIIMVLIFNILARIISSNMTRKLGGK